MPIYKKVNKNFFKTWTHDMAYVLGFFAADGNMVETKRGTHFISFYSADKNLIESIKKVLDADHAVACRKSTTGSVYRLQIGSKMMFNDLLQIGFYPGKSKRMDVPHIPIMYVSDFVRGYFDGDGNVWFGLTNKHRKKPTKTLQVAFTFASVSFLKNLKILLSRHGLIGGYLYVPRTGEYGRLLFSTRDALKIYKIMYNAPCKLYLKRKKLVFERFLRMRV